MVGLLFTRDLTISWDIWKDLTSEILLCFFCVVLCCFVLFCLVLFGFVWFGLVRFLFCFGSVHFHKRYDNFCSVCFCLVLFGFVWFCLVLFGFVLVVFIFTSDMTISGAS